MKKVIRIDNDGNFVEEVIVDVNEEIPNDCVDTICPDGFYRPRWNGSEWIEGLTQLEIDSIKNAPVELNEIEKLKIRQDATENALLFIMEMGVI